jgi:hypothetical protein
LVVGNIVEVNAGDLELKILKFSDDDLDSPGISIPTGAIALPALAGREALRQPLCGALYLCCGGQVLSMDGAAGHDVRDTTCSRYDAMLCMLRPDPRLAVAAVGAVEVEIVTTGAFPNALGVAALGADDKGCAARHIYAPTS